MDDDFDYSIPTVREVRERYVTDGDYARLCADLERAIVAYGVDVEEDLRWFDRDGEPLLDVWTKRVLFLGS